MSRRWSKFWWQDWARDPALRMCSPAARGVWMDMLCVMADASPVGHLIVNGRQPNTRQLGSIFGISEREAERLIAELEEAGVFSRTEEGVIYNRRLVRDAEVSEAGREAISKRWGTKKETSEGPTSPPNRGATPDPTGDPCSLYSEAESEKKEPSASHSAPAAPLPRQAARDALFLEGVAIVGFLTGLKPRSCKSLIGEMLKRSGDNAAECLRAVRDAAEFNPADASAWLLAAAAAAHPDRKCTATKLEEALGLPTIEEMDQHAREWREQFEAEQAEQRRLH